MLEAVIILAAGSGVGFVAGLFGVGGSFLLVPLLSVATSLPMELLVGSCACQVLGPATAAIVSYRPRLAEWRIPIILLGGILSGTWLGSSVLRSWELADDPSRVTQAVQFGYLVLLWQLGLFSGWEARRQQRGKPIPIGWFTFSGWGPSCSVFGRQQRHEISIISLSGFGLGVGFLSGFLGLSGGVVLVPGLHYFYGIPTKRAARLSMILVALIAVQATCIHASFERVDLSIVLWLLLGGTVGARLGVQVSERMTGGTLRRQFSWLMISAAILFTLACVWPH